MKQRQRKFMMVLLPTSLFLVWRLITLIAKPTIPAPAAAAVMATPESVPEYPVSPRPLQIEISDAVLDLQAKRAKLAWGRDPFASRNVPIPTTAPAATPVRAPVAPPWTLSGVSHASGRNLAILEGRIVSEGDRIADRYQVVEVSDREVVIRDGEWAHTFTLGVKGAQTVAVGENK